MKCPSVKQSLVYGTTTAIGAAAGLGMLVLTARVALPLFQKLSINPQSWLTRSAFIATGGATPWVASTTYRLATTTPVSDEEKEAFEEVKRLIEAKADLNAADENGHTRLHIAASRGHTNVIKQLVDAKANPNATDEDCWTPMHCAAECGHADIVKRLIEAGANLNDTDVRGPTPLHLAAYCGEATVATLLIKAKADLNPTDKYALTPLDLATNRGNADVVKLLEKAGATVGEAM